MNTPHPFDVATKLAARLDGGFDACTSPQYANMIGPFGGLTAAQLLQAVLQHPQRLGDPVSLTVNYCAAIADGSFVVQARPARTNRSTQHWTIELLQGGDIAATATAITALRRPTWGAEEHTMPSTPPPATWAPFAGPYRVEWLKNYEVRYVEGAFPQAWDGRDHGHSRSRLWLRDTPQRPLDWIALTALADVFFPRLWLRRATFVPTGTVTLTVYFHADAAALAAVDTGFVLAQAQGQGFRDGYFDHAGQLWGEAGTLLATTHSLYYYKE